MDAFLESLDVNYLFDVGMNENRTEDEVSKFINPQKKETTVRSTAAHLKCVANWLWTQKSEPRAIENIIPQLLNEYLSEFFVKVIKQDGSDYELSTLDCIKYSIERYLKDNNYPASIMNDREFHKTREAIKARKIDVKKRAWGAKAAHQRELSLKKKLN